MTGSRLRKLPLRGARAPWPVRRRLALGCARHGSSVSTASARSHGHFTSLQPPPCRYPDPSRSLRLLCACRCPLPAGAARCWRHAALLPSCSPSSTASGQHQGAASAWRTHHQHAEPDRRCRCWVLASRRPTGCALCCSVLVARRGRVTSTPRPWPVLLARRTAPVMPLVGEGSCARSLGEDTYSTLQPPASSLSATHTSA